MSTHPNAVISPSKPWTTPKISKIDLNSAPYADVIGILRSAVRQSEKDVSLNPNDAGALELHRSLRRMLDDLESAQSSSAA